MHPLFLFVLDFYSNFKNKTFKTLYVFIMTTLKKKKNTTWL